MLGKICSVTLLDNDVLFEFPTIAMHVAENRTRICMACRLFMPSVKSIFQDKTVVDQEVFFGLSYRKCVSSSAPSVLGAKL